MRLLPSRFMLSLKTLLATVISVLLVATLTSQAAQATDATSNAEAQQMWQQIADDYRGVTYLDLIRFKYPQPGASDSLTARSALRQEGVASPTQDQVKEKAQQLKGLELSLEPTFNEVKAELDTLMPYLLVADNYPAGAVEFLRNNKQSILLGLTYMKHYYSFKIGEKPFFSWMVENKGDYNLETISLMGFFEEIGRRPSVSLYRGRLADRFYNDYLRTYLRKANLGELISAERKLRTGETTSDEEWFLSQVKAHVLDLGRTHRLYSKLTDNTDRGVVTRSQLLTLLALKEPSVYVLNTDWTIHYGLTSLYGGADNPQFLQKLSATGKEQIAHYDFWSRIHAPNVSLHDRPYVMVVDAMLRSKQFGERARERWSPWYGQNVEPGVRDFFLTSDLYAITFTNAQAAAEGEVIRYYMQEALGQPGVATYSHELTHMYDKTTYFDGHGRRATLKVEDYARGLLETENNTQPVDGGQALHGPIFNLNTAFELGQKRLQNQSPTRFQTPDDIGEYMRGFFDVVYSLDAMEAEAILELGNADKALMLNKVSVALDPNEKPLRGANTVYSKDVFERISEAEAANLQSLDNLVDQNIVSSRLLPKGTANSATEAKVNTYIVVPIFEPAYAGLNSPTGATGGFLFRRYAHELLGEFGWRDGFVPYVSDKHGNENGALNAILAQYNGSMAEFKKAMFKRRTDKYDLMKPAGGYENADQMKAAMKTAVAADLATIKNGIAHPIPYTDRSVRAKEIHNLKKKILQDYLVSTSDFRTSIYKEDYSWEAPLTAQVTLQERTQTVAFQPGDFKLRVVANQANPAKVTQVASSEISVPADGRVDLTKWVFPKAGTYRFTVEQVAGTNPAIEYDTQAVEITVVAAEPAQTPQNPTRDAGGAVVLQVKPTFTKAGQTVNEISFANQVKPRSATYRPAGIPVELKQGDQDVAFFDADFAVRVTLGDDAPAAGMTGLTTEEYGNSGKQFVVGELTFTKPGTYKLTYTQVPQNDQSIVYDEVPVVETIVVAAHPTDATKFVVSSTYQKGTAATDTPKFTNTKKPVAPVVTYRETTEQVVIEIEEEIIKDPELYENVVRTDAVGETGLREITKRQRLEDGKPVGEPEIIKDVVVREMKKKVIRQGTKPLEKYRWELPITVQVKLTENDQPKAFAAGDFQVNVVAADSNPAAVENLPTGPVSVAADGSVNLGTWAFFKAGDYSFTLTQTVVNSANTLHDGKPIVVKIRVERPATAPQGSQPGADGFIVVAPTITFEKEGQPLTELTFENQYNAPKPVETYEDTVEEVAIEVTTVEEIDPEAYVGTEVVVSAGKPGVMTITKRQRLLDGKPVGEPEVVSRVETVKMEPRVVRKGTKPRPVVAEKVTVEVKPIPIETVVREDNTLDLGIIEIISEGAEGTLEIKTVQPTVDGVPQGNPTVTETVLKPMEPKVVRKGTKPIRKVGEALIIDLPNLEIPEVTTPQAPKPTVEVSPKVQVVQPRPTLPATGSTAGWLVAATVLLALLGAAGIVLSKRGKK
ncbi:MAG: ZmpA/ZmpB/ZmpC family metallo-endopeptidase [Actinomycetaceae bacterium]|nr:ZmpA/ZmpB/ZmpC family metallo-endopeptidase [Actinomycetaceae bacterium]